MPGRPPARIRRATIAVVGLVAMALALLAGCAHPRPSVDELTAAFVTSGLPEGQARCVSKALVDTLSGEELDLLVERGDTGSPRNDPATNDDTMDRLGPAFTACTNAAIEAGEITTTTAAPATAPATSAPATSAPAASSTTGPTTVGSAPSTTAAP